MNEISLIPNLFADRKEGKMVYKSSTLGYAEKLRCFKKHRTT
jgi:hypothetical protein